MPAVASYFILFRGGASQTMRAQIALSDAAGLAVAYMRFYDLGALTANDSVDAAGVITMNLPFVAFQSVLDVLRNEQPLNVYFAGLGFFGTGTPEPVGEGE